MKIISRLIRTLRSMPTAFRVIPVPSNKYMPSEEFKKKLALHLLNDRVSSSCCDYKQPETTIYLDSELYQQVLHLAQ